jgi:ABC-type transport system involved in multi-copper enzyme maturation permease subunit
MLRLIISRELRDIIGSVKFGVTFGVMATLVLLAFYVGARNHQAAVAEYEAAVSENLRQMEGLTNWNTVDNRIVLRPRPLAALVSGISNDIGRTVRIGPETEPRSEYSRFDSDPILAVFGFIDLEFVFRIALSLFAILFAYDAVSGEKERGTLSLALSNSVPRDRYILGKLIGAFLALAVPLLIPILLGCLMFLLMGVPLDQGEWLRLGLVLLTGFVYLGVFLSASVLVSSATSKSSSSFLTLIVIWTLMVVVMPRMAVLVSAQWVDVPSIDQINFEKSTNNTRLLAEVWAEADEFWRNNPPPPEMSAEERRQRWTDMMSELHDKRNRKADDFSVLVDENRRNRELDQQRISLGLARISPAAAYELAVTTLAGTSLGLKQEFGVAALDYRRVYGRFLREKTGNVTPRQAAVDQEGTEEIDPREMPVFEFRETGTVALAAKFMPDLAILLIYLFVFFGLAFVAFLRYDVR